MMGIETLEVKFLDRFGISRSEGVLQGHVRRSRPRVFGSEDDQLPSWSTTVNYAGSASAVYPAYQGTAGSTLLRREIKACGFRGEYCRRAETERN